MMENEKYFICPKCWEITMLQHQKKNNQKTTQKLIKLENKNSSGK